MVPSQLSCEESNTDNNPDDNDNTWPSKSQSVSTQGNNSFNYLKHLNGSVYKLADAAGIEWCQSLMEGLYEIRAMTIQMLGGATSISRMGTLPKSTNKKLDY